jgi:hypothetical protein
MHQSFKNILSIKELEYFIDYYNSQDHYLTRAMEKVLIPFDNEEFMTVIDNLIQNKLGVNEKYKIVGDNFYKHKFSYFPHCDATNEQAWLNIVIPLEQYNKFGDQKFIVFDQMWTGKNMTWCGNANINLDFRSNKKTEQRPVAGEYFTNSTNTKLSDSIWQEMDHQYFDQDYFYGMSGTVYDWQPRDIIVFDSQHIHATGKMQSDKKLGLSIRIEKI